MTPDEIKKRVDRALARTDTINQAKANLGGQLQAKKEELAALVKEIRDAGLEPKTLAAARDKVQAELEAMIVEYEKKLDDAETAIAAIKK